MARCLRSIAALSVVASVVGIATWATAVSTAPDRSGAAGFQSPLAKQVHSEHQAMLRWLDGSRHEAGWREYLQCDPLESQLRRRGEPNREILAEVFDRYCGGASSLHDRRFVAVRLSLRNWLSELSLSSSEELADPHDGFASESDWWTDYFAACRAARKQRKLLLLFFYHPGRDAARDAFEAEVWPYVAVGARRHRYVWARLPVDYHVEVPGQESIRLLDHPAFREMQGRQGVAIIDYENPGTRHYRRVVSQFPFSPGKYYRHTALATILDLPPGTLTQRTLIYAVRMHTESPRSAIGLPNHKLVRAAESHSQHQANITLQGHHNWESRFHQINAKLGGSLTSQEVVAESWPGETLVEAAVECVYSWRRSSGHWSAVRRRHAEYGYDMKRGSNGIWYATGIFAH